MPTTASLSFKLTIPLRHAVQKELPQRMRQRILESLGSVRERFKLIKALGRDLHVDPHPPRLVHDISTAHSSSPSSPKQRAFILGQILNPTSTNWTVLSEENQHGFLNISVTPLEASIVCHTSWAKEVFEPVINSLPAQKAKTVSVFTDSYMVLSVIGAGLDAATRVLELSSPLALAGIPIFFITTYYSDFILAPFERDEMS
ncbi:hypothetical protein J3459_002429 [Metarhizium acridum]|nr:hypothetical protein J3459_002429 [Metarhizium acridum]